jgi:hypothetical protein
MTAPGVRSIQNRRLYQRMQDIEKLPRRAQKALLRTIEAFIFEGGSRLKCDECTH